MTTSKMNELENLTLEQLVKEIEASRMMLQHYKGNLQHAEAELLSRTAGDFIQEMIQREKTHGSISKEIDGIKLTYEVKQTVSWDQDKLRSLWEALPPEVGSKLIKTEFSVSEAVFKNQVDPGLIDALVDARTTKLSNPSIKLNK
jgi:hypothetical protein